LQAFGLARFACHISLFLPISCEGWANSKPVFVELIAPPAAKKEECLIELESTRGDKMRIHWPASTAPDWTALLRAWRGTEQ